MPSDTYVVTFYCSLPRGQSASFEVEVHPDWAPNGAARFKELLEADFYTGTSFFRVVKNFIVQFGIHPRPEVSARWTNRTIPDDPVLKSNDRGLVSFASSGLRSRNTQLFVNLNRNVNLDGMGFAPFGVVVGDGMTVVDRIFAGYGEAPQQARILAEGAMYLEQNFPKLSYVRRVRIGAEPFGEQRRDRNKFSSSVMRRVRPTSRRARREIRNALQEARRERRESEIHAANAYRWVEIPTMIG